MVNCFDETCVFLPVYGVTPSCWNVTLMTELLVY